MANTAYTRGLVNPRLMTGGEPMTKTYAIAAGNATTFYSGQLVKVKDGVCAHLTTFLVAAQTSQAGVCQSYLTKSTAGDIQVITDLQNTIWDIQLVSAAVASNALLGDRCGFAKNGGVGRPATYQATMNAATTASHLTNGMAAIFGFESGPKNESTSANPVVTVRFVTELFAY